MNLSNGYLVLDLETTGLDRQDDRIVELAVGLTRPGETLRVQSWLISDWADRITPEATAIHGIEPWEARSLGIAMRTVLGVLSRMTALAPLPIVAHNGLRFDLPFLERAVGLLTGGAVRSPALVDHARWIDTSALYKGNIIGCSPVRGETHEAYAWRVLEQKVWGLTYNLPLVCEELGVQAPPARLHRAGGDVQLTDGLFRKLRSLGLAIDGLSDERPAITDTVGEIAESANS